MARRRSHARARCVRCLFPAELCVCALVARVPNRTEVVIVRHAAEARKPSNTARLAALALGRCLVLEHGQEGAPLDATILTGGRAWLLWPEGAEARPSGPPPERLVVLDGTWAQARRMLQRIAPLARLPRLSLGAPARPLEHLRAPPRPDALSTLEAIARALAVLDGEGVGAPLEALHEDAVRRALRYRRRKTTTATSPCGLERTSNPEVRKILRTPEPPSS